MAHACRKLPATSSAACGWQSFGPRFDALGEAAPSPVLGVVYGAGFEDRPELLARIAERWPLLGNDAETVACIKAPESFFATLDRLGIRASQDGHGATGEMTRTGSPNAVAAPAAAMSSRAGTAG